MKVLGIVLLTVGILSLIGGFVSPSDADSSVIIIGYILKIGLIIGGIALIQKKKKSKGTPSLNRNTEGGKNESNNKSRIPQTSTTSDALKVEEDKNNRLLKEVDLQEVELQKLKGHNLLNEEEYNIKREIVLKRKETIVKELDKIELERELEKVKSLVNEQIKPQLLLLESTFNSELLTQEEYESKRNQLFNDRYNSIFRMLTLDSSFKFNMDVKNEDSIAKIYRIEINKMIPQARIGDVMLINNFLNDLNKYSFDKFIEINKSDFSSKYSYINIPNLLDRLGYPQLQKKFKNESSVE